MGKSTRGRRRPEMMENSLAPTIKTCSQKSAMKLLKTADHQRERSTPSHSIDNI